MIKVFIYENTNDINFHFGEEDYNIPFLGGSLFDFLYASYKRFSDASGNELKLYVPYSWELDIPGVESYTNISSNLSEDNDVVFISSLFTLPLADFTLDDYHFLIQNQGKIFSHPSGLKLGSINKNTDISKLNTEDLTGFSNLVNLSMDNFLPINKALLENISSEIEIKSPHTYGNPVILCRQDNLINSKVCGPCFIGEDVLLVNSVVYPGTIIMGHTTVKNSELFESFICGSNLNEVVAKNSLVTLSSLEKISIKDSIIPQGSLINNARKG